MVARQAHYLEVVGSSPTPATSKSVLHTDRSLASDRKRTNPRTTGVGPTLWDPTTPWCVECGDTRKNSLVVRVLEQTFVAVKMAAITTRSGNISVGR